MVDAKDRVLGERGVQRSVQLARGGKAAAEGLFQDDAPACRAADPRDALVILSYAVGITTTQFRVGVATTSTCTVPAGVAFGVDPVGANALVGQDVQFYAFALDDQGAAVPVFSDFFRTIFGIRGEEPRSRRPQTQGYQQELQVSLEEAYNGTTRLIQSDGKQKQVRIPAGVRTGSKVRVAGAGPNGLDLYLIVDVQDDQRFERHGNDLHTTATVSVFTAILGGEADVETLNGKVKLNIPAGTQPEQVFRLSGRGMPHVRNPNEKGDLYVRLKVQIPKYLSAKQRELLDEASRLKF